MVKKRDYEAYLNYYIDHPNEFEDEPPIGGYSIIWMQKIQKGETLVDNLKRSSNGRRKRWEDYHLAKADILGFEIDFERLTNDMGIIHLYMQKDSLTYHIKANRSEGLMPPID